MNLNRYEGFTHFFPSFSPCRDCARRGADPNKDFAKHGVIVHSKGEYSRGAIYTDTVENYFSILRRGLTGVYQHVGARHLKRYIGEFDFRYNNREITDMEGAVIALRGISGKRLLYRDSSWIN